MARRLQTISSLTSSASCAPRLCAHSWPVCSAWTVHLSVLHVGRKRSCACGGGLAAFVPTLAGHTWLRCLRPSACCMLCAACKPVGACPALQATRHPHPVRAIDIVHMATARVGHIYMQIREWWHPAHQPHAQRLRRAGAWPLPRLRECSLDCAYVRGPARCAAHARCYSLFLHGNAAVAPGAVRPSAGSMRCSGTSRLGVLLTTTRVRCHSCHRELQHSMCSMRYWQQQCSCSRVESTLSQVSQACTRACSA